MKISKGREESQVGSQDTVTPFTIRTENKGDSKIFGKEQGGLNSSQFSLSRTQIISPITEDQMMSSQCQNKSENMEDKTTIQGGTRE